MFANLRIASRLAIGFGLVVVSLLAALAFALAQTGRVNDNVLYYADNLIPSYAELREITGTLDDVRRMEFRHVIASDEARMKEIEERRQALVATLFKRIESYDQRGLLSDEAERQLMKKSLEAAKQYFAFWPEVQAHSRASASSQEEAKAAEQLMNTRGVALYEAAAKAIDEWFDYNLKLADRQRSSSVEAYRLAMVLGAVLGAVGLGVSIAAAWVITRSVARPLAQAVEQARAVAGGDLMRDVAVQGKDETAELLRSLSAMTQSLRSTVGQVRAVSDSIATGTEQIATGNSDLSQRTEEQASALQQTAATMEQIGSTVRTNAESARQADRLAKDAADVAESGGQAVGEVVRTMQGISESSRRIGDIIGVIDGIAFQTNILALNAAVEAARAGEQGRGFAVVAGEVRTLAQRSAEAAREIKVLVAGNVEQVERGTAQVDEAGRTMTQVVGSIRKVSEIVSDITAATVEQSHGIGQVEGAIGQMDQATQQNAALVEETAAASEAMRAQAQQLVQAVSAFRLAAGR